MKKEKIENATLIDRETIQALYKMGNQQIREYLESLYSDSYLEDEDSWRSLAKEVNSRKYFIDLITKLRVDTISTTNTVYRDDTGWVIDINSTGTCYVSPRIWNELKIDYDMTDSKIRVLIYDILSDFLKCNISKVHKYRV